MGLVEKTNCLKGKKRNKLEWDGKDLGWEIYFVGSITSCKSNFYKEEFVVNASPFFLEGSCNKALWFFSYQLLYNKPAGWDRWYSLKLFSTGFILVAQNGCSDFMVDITCMVIWLTNCWYIYWIISTINKY